jgi:hypothetical protein
MDHHPGARAGGEQFVMRRLALALLAGAALLAVAPRAVAADRGYGRLFYTPTQRAALADARRRNIRAEELAAEAAKRPKAPRSRKVTLTGIVQRSDGESFAWVNGKPVEGQTRDGLRVRHFSGPAGVVVYDPEKGRTVSVKVGQRVDLLTGRIEEPYERKRAEPAPTVEGEAGAASAPAREQPRKEQSQAEAGDKEQDDDDGADNKN